MSDHVTESSASEGFSPIATTNFSETSFSLAKQLFSDCALVEIIHLHDCIRVSLQQIKNDVTALVTLSLKLEQGSHSSIATMATNPDTKGLVEAIDNNTLQQPSTPTQSSLAMEIHAASKLSGAVSSRFHLIWSVFQAHSHAEDEFIWPALKAKVQAIETQNQQSTIITSRQQITPSGTYCDYSSSVPLDSKVYPPTTIRPSANNNKEDTSETPNPATFKCSCETLLEQQEYEDDHAKEETMFQQIHDTIRKLHVSKYTRLA